MSKETLGKDINGAIDFSLPKPVYVVDTTLTASVEQNTTTPPNFNRAFFSFSPGANVFVAIDDTASLPSTSFAQTTSELLPSIRQLDIDGGQTISFVSDIDAYVSIRYDLGENTGSGG